MSAHLHTPHHSSSYLKTLVTSREQLKSLHTYIYIDTSISAHLHTPHHSSSYLKTTIEIFAHLYI